MGGVTGLLFRTLRNLCERHVIPCHDCGQYARVLYQWTCGMNHRCKACHDARAEEFKARFGRGVDWWTYRPGRYGPEVIE